MPSTPGTEGPAASWGHHTKPQPGEETNPFHHPPGTRQRDIPRHQKTQLLVFPNSFPKFATTGIPQPAQPRSAPVPSASVRLWLLQLCGFTKKSLESFLLPGPLYISTQESTRRCFFFFSGGCKEITAGLCAPGSRRGSAGALGAFPRGRAARFRPLSAPGGFLLAAGFHFSQTTTSKPHSSPDLPPKATRPLQSQTGRGVRPGALGPLWGLLARFPRAGGGSEHPRGVRRCLPAPVRASCCLRPAFHLTA